MNSDLTAEVSAALNFLTTQHGATLETDQQPQRTVLAYLLADLFIEIELDWKEGAAFALVGRLDNGRRPGGYYVHQGVTVRRHLATVLATSDDPQIVDLSARVRAAARESGPNAMEQQVESYASALRTTVDALPGLVE